MGSFGDCVQSAGNNDVDEDGEMDMINWEKLEDEVNLAKATKKDSRFLHSLNLREEIRRQLAGGDAQRTTTGNGLKKSKSAFLNDTSSSESEDDDGNFDDPVVTLSDCSSEEFDDDKEFYLNDEFTTKITLHKTSASSNFRSIQESTLELSDESKNSRPLEKLVVRPLQSRPGLKTRIQNQKDLQICFLNDFTTREGSPVSSAESCEQFSNRSDGPSLLSQEFWSPPAETSFSKRLDSGSFMPKSKSMFEIDSEKQKSEKYILKQFEESEMKWRQEMQIKIQRSHERIHLQMQRQRKKQKKMAITTKVQFPHGKTRLDRQFLSDMNITHLQIILNDLHGQIESLNDELVRLLEQRDELHMEQDSKLVDIDDLSRRLKDQWMSNWRRQKKDVLLVNDSATSANKNSHPSSSGHSPLTFGWNKSNASSGSSSNGSLQNFRQKIRSLLS